MPLGDLVLPLLAQPVELLLRRSVFGHLLQDVLGVHEGDPLCARCLRCQNEPCEGEEKEDRMFHQVVAGRPKIGDPDHSSPRSMPMVKWNWLRGIVG